jgi:hypothetical protein
MKRKIYEPVREFERATSYCPLYLAWRILDEARDYFRTSWVPSPGSATLTRSRPLTRPSRAFASQIPFTASQAAQVSHLMGEGLADKLAHRAEAVFARHPFWARKATPRAGSRQFQSQRQREFILKFMRHWLAGVLAKENPALFRQLPESFKVGHPLPQEQTGGAAAPPHFETVGLTCRSASKSGLSQPTNRFVHGCELLAG